MYSSVTIQEKAFFLELVAKLITSYMPDKLSTVELYSNSKYLFGSIKVKVSERDKIIDKLIKPSILINATKIQEENKCCVMVTSKIRGPLLRKVSLLRKGQIKKPVPCRNAEVLGFILRKDV